MGAAGACSASRVPGARRTCGHVPADMRTSRLTAQAKHPCAALEPRRFGDAARTDRVGLRRSSHAPAAKHVAQTAQLLVNVADACLTLAGTMPDSLPEIRRARRPLVRTLSRTACWFGHPPEQAHRLDTENWRAEA